MTLAEFAASRPASTRPTRLQKDLPAEVVAELEAGYKAGIKLGVIVRWLAEEHTYETTPARVRRHLRSVGLIAAPAPKATKDEPASQPTKPATTARRSRKAS